MAGEFGNPEVVQEEVDILFIGGGMACCGAAYEVMRWAEVVKAETGKDPMPPALLSTHPSHPERILKLMDAMPKALEERSRSGQVATPIIVR